MFTKNAVGLIAANAAASNIRSVLAVRGSTFTTWSASDELGVEVTGTDDPLEDVVRRPGRARDATDAYARRSEQPTGLGPDRAGADDQRRGPRISLVPSVGQLPGANLASSMIRAERARRNPSTDSARPGS